MVTFKGTLDLLQIITVLKRNTLWRSNTGVPLQSNPPITLSGGSQVLYLGRKKSLKAPKEQDSSQDCRRSTVSVEGQEDLAPHAGAHQISPNKSTHLGGLA